MPHLDYAVVIYDKPFNDSSKEKLEKVEYSAALTIAGAIKGTSGLLGNVYIKNLVLNLIVIKGGTVNYISLMNTEIVKRLALLYLLSYLPPDNKRILILGQV